MQQRVAIVEDEPDISAPLSYSLRAEGFEAQVAHDGLSGLEMIRRTRPHLAIVDLMLPGIDGFEIVRRLRMDTATRNLPIMLLTAKDDPTDVVLGLGLGADDYITKPFSTAELLARLRAVLKRGTLAREAECDVSARVGDLLVDKERFEATLGSRRLGLTVTEFRILYALARRPDCVFRRDELLNEAVGESVYVIDRNIDVHIRSIRKKLGRPELIRTVRGVGYRLESTAAGVAAQ